MELLEAICAQLEADRAEEMCELAAADSQMFYAEVVSLRNSGQLSLPVHIVRTVMSDLHQFRD
jgi:hypothetical protein